MPHEKDKEEVKENPNELEIVPVAGEEILPLPLDRGYAWIVTFACMMNSFIVDGIANSFGLLLPDFCEYFQADKSSVTLIGSLLCGVYLLVGPVVGPLVNKFGCRLVCIAGSIVSAGAFLASSFAPTLTLLAITYGVIGGIGFGLIYLPSMVCVNYYFEKYRPLAMGIAVCGTGIGTIFMGPITNILIEVFGWKNALMILAGIVLNTAVFGALMKPNSPSVNIRQVNQPGRRQKISVAENGSQSRDVDKIEALAEEYVRRGRGDSEGLAPGKVASKIENKERSESEGAKFFASVASGLSGDTNAEAVLRSMPSIFAKEKRKRSRAARANSVREFNIQKNRTGLSTAAINDFKRPLYRKDIFYSGSVMNLGGMQVKKSQQALSPSLLMLSMTRIPGEVAQGDRRTPKGQQKRHKFLRFLPRSFVDALILMTDLSIMQNSSFAIIWMGNLVAMMAFYVPLFFVNDFALELGVSVSQARYLNSAFGAANAVSRVLVGMLAAHPKVSPLVINNLSLLLSGVLSVLLNLCNGFLSLVIVYTMLGVTLSPIIALTSEILCSMVGLDKLTNAFGFIVLARGLSTCIGSPITASLYNEHTRYLLPFLLGGLLFVASSVIFSIVFLPTLQRKRRQTRCEVEHAIRSVQSLSASIMLVEGRQIMVSSVDLNTGAFVKREEKGGKALSLNEGGCLEATV